MGLELLEEDVGRDFEKAVWDEEDDERGVVLCRSVVDLAIVPNVEL